MIASRKYDSPGKKDTSISLGVAIHENLPSVLPSSRFISTVIIYRGVIPWDSGNLLGQIKSSNDDACARRDVYGPHSIFANRIHRCVPVCLLFSLIFLFLSTLFYDSSEHTAVYTVSNFDLVYV